MEYQHLLEKYEDMSLIAALILPEHTEDAINQIGKTMNIAINTEMLTAAMESSDTKGKVRFVILNVKGSSFILIAINLRICIRLLYDV